MRRRIPRATYPKAPADHRLQQVHAFLFGLAPGGVYHATTVASCAVRSYRTISPLPAPEGLGGIFSAALSVGFLRPGVTWHPVLWSPDFPLPLARQRSSGRLSRARYCFRSKVAR